LYIYIHIHTHTYIQDDLQKSTDEFIKKLDTMLKTKEKDLLTL
jgi:ribosome recycling factor